MAVVTFDPSGPLRIIEISTGGDNSLTWAEIYSDWKRWVLVGDNAKYPPAFAELGGNPTVGSDSLGITLFLLKPWKLRPAELSHRLILAGNIFVGVLDDTGSPVGVDEPIDAPVLGAFTVSVGYKFSNLADARVLTVHQNDLVQQGRKIQYLIETGIRSDHGAVGEMIFLDPINGDDAWDGTAPEHQDGVEGPKLTWDAAYALAVDGRHDIIQLTQSAADTIIEANAVLGKRDLQVRGPGPSVIFRQLLDSAPAIRVTAAGCGIQGFTVEGAAAGAQNLIEIAANDFEAEAISANDARGNAIVLEDGIDRVFLENVYVRDPVADGLVVGTATALVAKNFRMHGGVNGIRFVAPGVPTHIAARVQRLDVHHNSGYGIVVPLGSEDNQFEELVLYNNALGGVSNLEPSSIFDDSYDVDSNIAASGIVATGSTAGVVRTSISKANNYFDRMYLFVQDGAAAAVRKIDSYAQADGAFTLDTALPFTPTTGAAIAVLAQYSAAAGAGEADWTVTERSQIRHRLGIDGTIDVPAATPSLATAAAVAALPGLTADAVLDEVLADHDADGSFGGEVATKADVRAAAATDYVVALSGSIVAGTLIAGTYVSTQTRDGVYWQIQESAVGGITVELTFQLPSAQHRPGEISVFGRYTGTPSTSHYQELWAYNYLTASFEQLAETFLPGGNTSDDQYVHEVFERHVDRANSNEVRIRIVHNATTYNAGHNLYLDRVLVSGIRVITAAEIADAVWDEALAGHATPGTTGEAEGRLDTAVSSRAAPGAAMDLVSDAVDAAALAASAVTEIQAGLATAGAVAAVPAATADAVWDEPVSGHLSTGTFGRYSGRVVAAETTATAGSTSTVIRTGLTQADDFYNNMQVIIINAAGIAVRNVDDFANTNGAITVSALPFTPAVSDTVLVLARTGSVPVDSASIADAVWDESMAEHLTPGSTGETLNVGGTAAITTTVKSGFALNTSTDTLDGNLWLEKSGQIITAVTSASVEFYSSSGSLLFAALTDPAPDAQGVFRVTKVSPTGLTPETTVYARLQIVTPSETVITLQAFQVAYTKTGLILNSLIFGN